MRKLSAAGISSALVVLAACGGESNGTAHHVDVGNPGDASTHDAGSGTGGSAGSGGISGSGGRGTGGSPHPTADHFSPPACCQSDGECGSDPAVHCVHTICLGPPLAGCFRDDDCKGSETCSGAKVCPCNADCSYSAVPGTCEPSNTDAAVDSGSATCLPAPTLPPTSPTCTDLPYSAASESYEIWVVDPSSAGGGRTISLALNQAVTVAGHVYKNTGAALVGGGAHGIYGDAWFDVDGVANALSFHFEGCATPAGTDTWELVAAVTRSGPSCSNCPELIEQHFVIHRTGSGASERYTFDGEGSPQDCGLGADLKQIVLY